MLSWLWGYVWFWTFINGIGCNRVVLGCGRDEDDAKTFANVEVTSLGSYPAGYPKRDVPDGSAAVNSP